MSDNEQRKNAPQLHFDLFRLESQASSAGQHAHQKKTLKPLKEPNRGTRINWFKLLDDMAREHYSLYDLSVLTGIPKSTLIGYRNQGHEPRHDNGEKLIAFWAQVTHNRPEKVPRIIRLGSVSDFRK